MQRNRDSAGERIDHNDEKGKRMNNEWTLVEATVPQDIDPQYEAMIADLP